MRPLLLPLFTVVAAMTVPSIASAQDVAPPDAPRLGWLPSSRVSLGARLVARFGDYTLGGVGGQVAVRLSPLVSVELFSDHLVGSREGSLRHDHEVGGVLRLHVWRGARWTVFPMLGACANLVVVHAAQARDATVNDVQFGARAGVGAEYALPRGFSIGAEALALAYLGHRLDGWGWRVEAETELSVVPMGQVVLHANYHF